MNTPLRRRQWLLAIVGAPALAAVSAAAEAATGWLGSSTPLEPKALPGVPVPGGPKRVVPRPYVPVPRPPRGPRRVVPRGPRVPRP